MPAIIRTERLTKSYGEHREIIDVDLEVQAGEVFGFLGPNGAGKTTTIRTLLDLIRPTSGRAFVFDIETTEDPVAIHRRIGYIPGEFALYDRLTGGQTIEYFGNLRGGVDRAYRDEIVKRLDIDTSRKFKEYSKGNKQKVGLVIALQHRPELLILDEPTSGLDPLVQQSFYELVREAQAEGRTVFLSSHILSEVEKTCDRVAIIRDGVLVKVDRTDALRDLAHHEVELRFADGTVPADAFTSLAGVSDVQLTDHTLKMRVSGPITPVRPGRCALRAARLREPRAVARGDVPRPVRHGSDGGGVGMTATTAPAGSAGRTTTSAFSRIYGLGSVYAKTLRDSRLAVIIVCGLIGAFLLSSGIAFGEAYTTVESRLELKALVSALPPAMAGVYGNPFPIAIETLGGSIAWKTAASLGLMAALWSVLALSGTIASEVRRGSLEFVATTPLGKRRIALEKLAAHVTGMAIVVLVTTALHVRRGDVRHAPGRRDLVDLVVRLRPLGRGRRAGVRIHRVRAGPVRRTWRLGGDRGGRPPVRLLRQRLPGRGTGLRAVREPDLVGLDRPPPAARQQLRLGLARPGHRAHDRAVHGRDRRVRPTRPRRRAADPVAPDAVVRPRPRRAVRALAR